MKTKRFLSIILSLALCIGILTCMAFTVSAEDNPTPTGYGVYVTGIEVTPDNSNDVLGTADGDSASVYYDPVTKTLTLDNAVLTADESTSLYNSPIEIDGTQDLTIYLKGNNVLHTTDEHNYILHRDGNLVITGEETAILTNKGDTPNNSGINTLTGKLTIEKVTIDLSYDDTAMGNLLFGYNGILIQDGANITVKSGVDATIVGGTQNIVISDSTVTASSSTNNALISNGTISITDNANVKAISYANYPAVYSYTALEISNANIEASTVNNNVIFVNGTISALDRAKIEAENASSDYPTVYASGTININNAVLTANNTVGSKAIYSEAQLSVSNDASVTAKGEDGASHTIITSGDINISDSRVDVTHNGTGRGISTDKNLYIKETASGTTNVTVNSNGIAIAARNGKLSISGGTVTATSAANTAALRADEIEVSGGKVTANAVNTYGMYAEVSDITISGDADVSATSETSTAVFAKGNINISENANVKASGQWAIWSEANNIVISGGTVEAISTDYAIVSKPVLTNYVHPIVFAGADANTASIVADMADTDYHNLNKYVKIQRGYIVTFGKNGGNGTMDIAVVSGEYKLPECTFTAPNGYEFKAWSVGDIEKSAGETITITENTTVTAVWNALAATVPTISAVSADLTGDNSLTYGDITAEDKLTVTAEADSSAEYDLTYQWYKAISASSQDGATDITGATEASYAIPTNTAAGDYYYYCTVTATRTDNGEKATADTRIVSVTILPKTISTAISLTAPVANAAPQTEIETDEYTAIVVWSPDVTDKFAYSTAYTATITITPKANYTVTGISENSYTVDGAETVTNEANSATVTVTYAETGRRPSSSSGGVSRYTVKFETNGGSTVASKTVTRNSTVDEPTAPTKDGYTFMGWYTDKELTKSYDFDTKVTKAITLYAKWEKHDDENIDDKTDDKPDTPDAPVWENPFTDVKSDDWYYENVEYAVENGLFNGTTTTTFAPNGIITRAMMVTVLYRAEGEPTVTGTATFEDVDTNAYYAKAVVWGQQNGIIKGYSETEFAPDQNITREQIAAIMHRYAQYKGYDVSVGENTNILSYTDFDSISEYAIASMQYAVGSGLMKGKTETTLNPKDNATRAEIAAILHRFIEAN